MLSLVCLLLYLLLLFFSHRKEKAPSNILKSGNERILAIFFRLQSRTECHQQFPNSMYQLIYFKELTFGNCSLTEASGQISYHRDATDISQFLVMSWEIRQNFLRLFLVESCWLLNDENSVLQKVTRDE